MKGAFLFITCLLVCDLAAQPVFFNHITQENGLRSGNVRAIVKDYQGFIWIGTEDGLHRYDGYEMKAYHNQQGDTSTLSSNHILCLFEDTQRNLWVGTLGGGLCLYNREMDTFQCFKHENSPIPNNTIRTLAEGSDHKLYIGSSGLTRATIDAATQTVRFENLTLPAGQHQEANRVAAITLNLDGNLLVSVYPLGIFNFNCTAGTFSKHEINQWDNNVLAIFADRRRGIIWAGTWKNGLIAYEPATRRHAIIKASATNGMASDSQLSAFAADTAGNLWITSDYGLIKFPGNENPFETPHMITYLPDNKDQSGIHGSIIKAVYVDGQDKLWVGVYYEGVNVYDKKAMNFGTLAALPELRQASFTNISAIEEDDSHCLWIGTDGGGLFRYKDALTQAHEYTIEHVPQCAGLTKIKSMASDSDPTLWIGTWGSGLFAYNTTTGSCTKIKEVEGFITDNEIMALGISVPDYLWIGTFNHGLFRFSKKTKQLVQIKNQQQAAGITIDRISTIFVDSENNVWSGREAGGLSFCQHETTTNIPIITDHVGATATITALYRDVQDTLWIGVANIGLVAYDIKTKHTAAFTEKHGLANTMIQAIQQDSLGRLWLSTNNGISLFNKQNKTFTNFTKTNGLSASQFNKGSAITTHEGNMAFGNTRGLNYFNPQQFQNSDNYMPVVLTRLFINNAEQTVGNKNSVLSQNVTTTRVLHLTHKQNSFSVEFAALGFHFTNLTQYAHRLEGFDDDWVIIGEQRIVSYTNLAPGNYTLKIKASNGTLQQASPNMLTLNIIIIPAWWQTIWFKGALAMAIVVLAFVSHRTRIRYLLKQKKQLEAIVQERTSKLVDTNEQLKNTIEEINAINALLSKQRDEITEKTNEIHTQNEELYAQNDQIMQQQERLIETQQKLKEINANLEKIVNERTLKLQQTIQDLDKTVFELDRFVYSASHDLSAPLKSIRGLIEVIHMEKDPANMYVYTEHIKNTVLKLETVIQSMVDYSRNVHIQIKPEPFSLHDLVTEVISELTFAATTANLRYINEVSRELVIESDRARLKVVLHNLISNSIKYADKNKASSWIRVRCETEGQYWTLVITDNGIGIRKEYLDKIFNMYFRATETSKGSGLGLFIVKETLTKIGGGIKVKSEFGIETTFELQIPKPVNR